MSIIRAKIGTQRRERQAMTQHQAPPSQPQGPTRGNAVIEWIKGHKIISAIIAVVLIAALANLGGDDQGATPTTPSPTPTTVSPTPTETAIADVEVPDVVGKPGDEAQQALRDVGLRADFESTDGKAVFSAKNWVVTAQLPEGGQVLKEGEKVTLTVDRPASSQVETPPAESPTPVDSSDTQEQVPEISDEEALRVLRDYLDERADSNVMVARALTNLSLEDGVATATFDPSTVGLTNTQFMELNAFENMAEFVGSEACWDTPEAAAVRERIQQIDTFLADGSSLGSATTAELHALCRGDVEPEPTEDPADVAPGGSDPIDSTVAAQFCANQIEPALRAAGGQKVTVHWIAGVLANEMKDDGTRFVKVEATVDGAKYNVECYIAGEGDDLALVDYALY